MQPCNSHPPRHSFCVGEGAWLANRILYRFWSKSAVWVEISNQRLPDSLPFPVEIGCLGRDFPKASPSFYKYNCRNNKLKNAESNNSVIDITVVTRYREILDYCAGIPDCHAVLSPDSEKGISYTIKAGIMAVQEQKKTGMQDYYMFAVADQPYLKSQSVIKLIDKVLENKGNMRLFFSLRCGDAVGNPCVFHSSLIPQLLSLEGDKGGRSVAKKYDCVYVDIADERELMDIDTLSDSKHTVTL